VIRNEERKGIGWWQTGIWRLKGMRRNADEVYTLYAGRK
jgi:hypothetical protein